MKVFTLSCSVGGVHLAVFTWKSAEHCLMVHCLMVHCLMVHCLLELRLELMKTEIKTGLAGLER